MNACWPWWESTTGDLDGDGLDEIVAGLATNPSSGGWLAIYDDAEHDHAFLAWRRIEWSAYNATNGETVPACGDLDGDGKDEIVVGLGRYAGQGGWLYVMDDASAGFERIRWVRVPWRAYDVDGGGTRPACGDLDGDGLDELVVGLDSFPGSGGWLYVMDDAGSNFDRLSWLRVPWRGYNVQNGSSRPACGDLDGDGSDEIVTGLGTGSCGWLPVFSWNPESDSTVQWIRIPWSAYNVVDGESRPACGDVDGDGVDEVVLGLAGGPITNGRFCALDFESANAQLLAWLRVPWTGYSQSNGETWPAVAGLRVPGE